MITKFIVGLFLFATIVAANTPNAEQGILQPESIAEMKTMNIQESTFGEPSYPMATMSLNLLRNCTTDADCSYNGFCENDGKTCHCDDHYATFPYDSDPQCNYKRKTTMTAGCLEFFFGIVGAGDWYLGNTVIATVILCLSLGGCGLALLLAGIAACTSNPESGAPTCLCTLLVLESIAGIWGFVRFIMMVTGGITDSNGIALYQS